MTYLKTDENVVYFCAAFRTSGSQASGPYSHADSATSKNLRRFLYNFQRLQRLCKSRPSHVTRVKRMWRPHKSYHILVWPLKLPKSAGCSYVNFWSLQRSHKNKVKHAPQTLWTLEHPKSTQERGMLSCCFWRLQRHAIAFSEISRHHVIWSSLG